MLSQYVNLIQIQSKPYLQKIPLKECKRVAKIFGGEVKFFLMTYQILKCYKLQQTQVNIGK